MSGQVTFGATGTVMVNFGVPVNELWFFAGSRDATVETSGLSSVGHADAGYQFCRFDKDGKAERDKTRCLTTYDVAGNKVLQFKVTGGWGTSVITFSVTAANNNYPFDVVVN